MKLIEVLLVLGFVAVVSCRSPLRFGPAETIFERVREEFEKSLDSLQKVSENIEQEIELQREHESLTWEQWKGYHNKAYPSFEEELVRKDVWKKNMQYIMDHNRQHLGYYLSMNHFGDMTHDEFKNYMLMKAAPIHKPERQSFVPPADCKPRHIVDWRQGGTEKEALVLDFVKNQGQCGSCWAFSAVGALEGQWQRKMHNKPMVSLSEQNLVDCSSGYGNMGCNGGLMDNAFQYIQNNGGLPDDQEYPYTATEGVCKTSHNLYANVTGYMDILAGNETDLQHAVSCVGPVSVAIDASHMSFQFYSQGVYDPPNCSPDNLDHGVLAVGFGTLDGKDYWIVRNSWGETWGLKGYILMARNDDNKCGIASSASYPLV
eukprot:Sdes_comp22405_c0_seq1m20866